LNRAQITVKGAPAARHMFVTCDGASATLDCDLARLGSRL
jgi:hypothetical protein